MYYLQTLADGQWETMEQDANLVALLEFLSGHDDEPGRWRIVSAGGLIVADNAPRSEPFDETTHVWQWATEAN